MDLQNFEIKEFGNRTKLGLHFSSSETLRKS